MCVGIRINLGRVWRLTCRGVCFVVFIGVDYGWCFEGGKNTPGCENCFVREEFLIRQGC